MIKFINWFIRPLGYVCVNERELEMERLNFYGTTLDDASRDLENLSSLLKSPSIFEQNLSSYEWKLKLDKEKEQAEKNYYAYRSHFIGFEYGKEEKPEYKDNVVPFDKHV